MPIQGLTPNKNLTKISSGSTDNWDVWANANFDILDDPVFLYQISSLDNLVAGDVAVIKDDGFGGKKTKLATNINYTAGDPLGIVTQNVTAGSSFPLAISGRVQHNNWSFTTADKFVYLSASGTVTTTQTSQRIGFVLSTMAIYFNPTDSSIAGGQTNTVTGANGILNTGDNINATLAPTYGATANTVCEGNDARLHNQNSDSFTDSVSFEINAFANSARILTTGLTANRDFTLPDAGTKLVGESAGAVISADHNFNAGSLGLPTNAGAPVSANQAGDIVVDTNDMTSYLGMGGAAWRKQGESRAFSVYQSITQNIASNVWTKLVWNSAFFDDMGDFDLVNGKFIPSRAGRYLLTYKVHITSVTDGAYVWGGIYRNGSPYSWSPLLRTGGAGTTGTMVSAVVNMNGSTDFAEFYVKQNTGVSQNTQTGNSYTNVSGFFLEG